MVVGRAVPARGDDGVSGGATERKNTGGRLVTLDGRVLPLRGVAIAADAGGGLARVRLKQRFVNPYPEPLRVTYQVPLPVEGALAGYTIRIGDRRIVGEKQHPRHRTEVSPSH